MNALDRRDRPGLKARAMMTKPTQGAEYGYTCGHTTFLNVPEYLHTFAPSSAVVDRDARMPPIRLSPFSGLRLRARAFSPGRSTSADAVIDSRSCPVCTSPA